MTYHYHIYGLSIKSELNFPELEPCVKEENDSQTVTITLRKSKPRPLKEPIVKGLFYQINVNEFWQHIPSIGYFTIRDGKAITVYPTKNVDEDSLRETILTLCLRGILSQRGLYVLQGTSIQLKKGCYAIVGVSGAGKSTLAAALFKKGYSILSDDLVVMTPQGHVLSGYPYLKLWLQALKALDFDVGHLKKVRPQLHKYLLPVASKFHSDPLPIKGIYMLHDNNNEGYEHETLTGIKKIHIIQNLKRFKMIIPDIENKILPNMINIAQQVFVESIIRPHNEFKLDDCVSYIEKNLEERGLEHG